MKTYTLETIKRNKNQDGLFDIFTDTVVDYAIHLITDYIREDETGRLDLVSLRLYGNKKYMEELMTINNILNSFTIEFGDEFKYVEHNNITLFNKIDEDEDKSTIEIIKNKNTRKDLTRNVGVTPTTKPVDFEHIIIENETITLNTKLS